MPDEEIGGGDGMAKLLETLDLSEVEIALDEGLANEANAYTIFFGERTVKWIKITSKGNIGHGSQFIESTAVEKLINILKKAYEFRESQKR